MALNDPITAMERFVAVITNNGEDVSVMSIRMAEFIETLTLQVNQNIPASGIGSPEGVVEAEPFKTYLDTVATAGSNFYIKKTGSGSAGWILV